LPDGTRYHVAHFRHASDASFVENLVNGHEALRAERDALAARVEQLLRAGDTLSICAQTTGGTAGPDDGLIEAIKGWERARAALSTVREKTDERA
jgi:hypothetical protein